MFKKLIIIGGLLSLAPGAGAEITNNFITYIKPFTPDKFDTMEYSNPEDDEEGDEEFFAQFEDVDFSKEKAKRSFPKEATDTGVTREGEKSPSSTGSRGADKSEEADKDMGIIEQSLIEFA
jgi:hypothetical protein